MESARWARCKQGRARGVIRGYQIAAILTYGPGNLAQIQNILATAGATLIKMNKFIKKDDETLFNTISNFRFSKFNS